MIVTAVLDKKTLPVTTIVVAHEAPDMQCILKAILAKSPEFKVVGSAGDEPETCAAAASLGGDVLVLSDSAGGMVDLGLLRLLCSKTPKTAIVILSTNDDENRVLATIRFGAKGNILRDRAAYDLAPAVRAVARGYRYLGAPFLERAIRHYIDTGTPAGDDAAGNLTGTEHQVLYFMLKGITANQIAANLRFTRRTVQAHGASLMRKLNVRNETELARYVQDRGAAPMESVKWAPAQQAV